MPLDGDRLHALLAELTSIAAVAGREESLAAWVEGFFQARALPTRRDALGNVVGVLEGAGASPGASPRPSVMIAAHMDEIGLVVTSIEPSGALRVAAVGGVNRHAVLAQEVVVHGRRELPGVIGTIPPHLTTADERKKFPEVDDLFIDVGLPPERVREWVRPGDAVSFRGDLLPLLNGRIAAKSMDNRAGLAAMLGVVEALLDEGADRPAVDLLFAATTQEEVGLRGAAAAAYGFAPRAAIAIDVGFGDTLGIDKRGTITLGEGPAIMTGPNVHPGVYRALVAAAEAEGIPYQVEVAPGSSGTDAWAIQVAREGVATGVVSLPLRYMHSTVELLDSRDVEATARLLTAFCRRITPDDLEEWHGGIAPRRTE